MKDEVLKYIKVTIGVILCALGIVMILNADMGLSPWDVLNQGINMESGITLGQTISLWELWLSLLEYISNSR